MTFTALPGVQVIVGGDIFGIIACVTNLERPERLSGIMLLSLFRLLLISAITKSGKSLPRHDLRRQPFSS